MKKVIFNVFLTMLISITLLNITSCNYSLLNPKSKTPDSPEINTKWKSENPDMFFTVSKNGSLGKAVINGEKINISVNFEFYCNQLHISKDAYNKENNKTQRIINPSLDAKFKYDGNSFEIYSITNDKLFNGEYKTIKFFKE